eukprot:gene27689-28617_t
MAEKAEAAARAALSSEQRQGRGAAARLLELEVELCRRDADVTRLVSEKAEAEGAAAARVIAGS